MANAKKCDRCKKYYDDNVYKSYMGRYITKVAECDKNTDVMISYDLCTSCLKDFINFMEGMSVEKVVFK